MARIIKETWKNGAGQQVTVVSTGPMTNIALFVNAYSDLLMAVEEFVFMGGGVGMGNRSAVAEYNILCDRERLQSLPVTSIVKNISFSPCCSNGTQRTSEEDHDAYQRHSYGHRQ